MMKRISMAQARKLYSEGADIYLLPSKAVPGSVWILPIKISKDGQTHSDFDTKTNAYRYYNCTAETGKYIHFYIKS